MLVDIRHHSGKILKLNNRWLLFNVNVFTVLALVTCLFIQWNPLISNSDYRDFRILATFCPAQNHFLFSLYKFAPIIEIPLQEIFG